MRKSFVIVLLLLLVACAKAPTVVEQTPIESEVGSEGVQSSPAQSQVTEPVAQQEPAIGVTAPVRPLPSERVDSSSTTTVTAPKEQLSPQIRDLLKRAEEKLTSMQYLYGGTATKNLFLDTYLLKGDKMKVKKYEENYYVRDGYFDTIYVNDAIGCCEELSRCKSHNVDNTNKKFDVDVESLNVPLTPKEWLLDIQSSAKVVGPQTFNERSVTYIKYQKDGNEVSMWLDDTYGIPHKIVITSTDGSEIKHQFNDLKFNGLKDVDFVPPCAK
ncbi:hypothetical protein J4219_03650 [Candidatus Woesearchaeota archaeon]|nr:hypothetical protein [Candidatus Woesearchaeota archaeon]